MGILRMKNGRRDAMDAYVDSVNGRYRSDLLMNSGMVLVAVLPLVLGLVLNAAVSSLPYFSTIKGDPAVIAVPLMAALFTVCIVEYRMYTRLRDHSGRDSAWRKSLIGYARMYTRDTGELERLDREGDEIGSFPGRHPARLLVIIMYGCIVLLFFRYLLSMPDRAAWFAALSGAAVSALMFVTVFLKVLRFPCQHDRNQVRFVREFARVMEPYGVKVERMDPSVEERTLWKQVLLTVVTLGLYLFVLIGSSLRSMNDHIRSQWIYEDRLYVILRTDCLRKVSGQEPPEGDRVSTRSHFVSMPPTLIAAELFMAVICITYVLRLVAAGCDMAASPNDYDISLLLDNIMHLGSEGSRDFVMRYVMIIMQSFLLATTVNAMMMIASRRPKAWRSTVINCVTFLVPVWLSSSLYEADSAVHLFDLDPLIATVLLGLLMAAMLVSRSVREFYTPATMEVPGIGEWLKYAFCGDLELGRDLDFLGPGNN